MDKTQLPAPLVLVILDGWGISQNKSHNAISQAHTPQWDAWIKKQPCITLDAAGDAVGLPKDQMGNSEVGHMHIGAGRVISQDLSKINEAINNNTIYKNETLQAILPGIASKNTLHIMGLLSNGGVHSHEDHLLAILDVCKYHQCQKIVLHLFLDGRDTAPKSALSFIKKLKNHIANQDGIQIASIAGRYFAMDRDQRWERTKSVFDLITAGNSQYNFQTPKEAIDYFYSQGISDEFIPPSTIGGITTVNDGDSVLFFNFRSDRARQLTECFIKSKAPKIKHFITMTQYGEKFPTSCIFPPQKIVNTLGEVVANQHMRQLRAAETEKYAHVTFFLNGGTEDPFEGEDRILIPSPKVATYDLQPEMSAPQLTDALIQAISETNYSFIVCNYANADMVGHTGNFKAAIKAIECLDSCLGKLWQAVKAKDGQMLITADHGNAECMFNHKTNQAHTAHTNSTVPLLYVGDKWHFNHTSGTLIDIAPTVLSLLNLPIASEMTGKNLMEPSRA